MKPSELSRELRLIASAVRQNGRLSLPDVQDGIRRVVAALGPLWVMIDPAGPKASVFTSQEEAGQAAVETGGPVCEVGSVGVICYDDNGKLVCEPTSKLPCVGTEEPGEMAQGSGDTHWFDTRTAVPGDVLEPFVSNLLSPAPDAGAGAPPPSDEWDLPPGDEDEDDADDESDDSEPEKKD